MKLIPLVQEQKLQSDIMKLSVSMIVKNESSCLQKCLESVKSADEIVIVDTGSTDNTVEIAKKYTDKVYSGKDYLWRDDFAYSRNQSLSKCTGDWVLIIDADEKLEDNGIQKCKDAIVANPTVNTIMIEAWSDNMVDYNPSLRLFKRVQTPEIKWAGRIHNYLTKTGDVNVSIKWLVGYSEAHQKDPDRALRILSIVCKENTKAVREFYYLAREFWYRRDYKLAIYYWEDYLTRAYFGPEMADAHLMLAYCYRNIGNVTKARQECLEAININTNFKEALVFMSSLVGPGNSKVWKRWSETATNEAVLFVRCP